MSAISQFHTACGLRRRPEPKLSWGSAGDWQTILNGTWKSKEQMQPTEEILVAVSHADVVKVVKVETDLYFLLDEVRRKREAKTHEYVVEVMEKCKHNQMR